MRVEKHRTALSAVQSFSPTRSTRSKMARKSFLPSSPRACYCTPHGSRQMKDHRVQDSKRKRKGSINYASSTADLHNTLPDDVPSSRQTHVHRRPGGSMNENSKIQKKGKGEMSATAPTAEIFASDSAPTSCPILHV
jgi:hypothetical protein